MTEKYFKEAKNKKTKKGKEERGSRKYLVEIKNHLKTLVLSFYLKSQLVNKK
ncbi:hypothetical protein [Microbulbifer sp. TRSA007]|uniref:hypothetical protein n=1 Tax=Microbulbifer sp. TRSA007 TaxID=3243384 RepID=UPI00403A6B49